MIAEQQTHAAALLMSLVVLTAARSMAADWPQWRGPERTAVSAETGLLQSWPKNGPPLAWHASGLGSGYSSVVVSNGLVFTIGSREKDVVCSALDATTGKPRWTHRIGTTSRNPCSTPTVDGDRLYALDPDGDLVCLKTATGEVLWQKSFLDDFGGRMMSGRGYGESPLIDGEKLICTPGGPDAMLAALNKRTGAVLWKSQLPDIGPSGRDGAGFSSVVITDAAGIRQYVQLVGRGVIGVDATDGHFLWGYNGIANGTANIPTPVVRKEFVFAANGYNAGSVLLKLLSDGQGGVTAQEVYSLKGGRFQNHHGGVVPLGKFIYGGHGSNNGLPTCIDLRTGRVVWKRRGPGIGSAAVIYADGHLYFRYQNGIVALIEATPKGYRLKGTFQIPGTGGDSWAHPAIADARLYLREKDHLWVYDLKAGAATPATRPQQTPALGSLAAVTTLRKQGVSIESLKPGTSQNKQHALYGYANSKAAAQSLVVTLADRHLSRNGMVPTELLGQLQELPRAFILDLAGTRVSDAGLKTLGNLANLTGLNLEFCRNVTDAGFEHLQRAKRLRLLVLTGTAITDAGLKHLVPVRSLVVLDLEVCDGVTDAGCAVLGSMKQLRALVVKKTGFEPARITDAGLKSLSSLADLEQLNLYGNQITDAGLVHLKPLNRLRSLNLSLLGITDHGLVHLKPLRDLQHLELLYATGFAGPILTDAALEPLEGLTQLKSLDLSGARITDAGLTRLGNLKKLARLKLANTSATSRGIRQLKAALPDCEITR